MATYANPVEIIKKDIYIIKNDINDKLYVGQSRNPKKRFNEHCKKSNSKYSLISRAIQKYGREHFSLEVVEHNIELYNEREKYWISALNTLAPYGYNVLRGGDEPPIRYGDDSSQCKLTDEELCKLKKDLRDTDESLMSLAKKYNISKKQVLRINHGVSRCVLGEQYPIRQSPNRNGKLSEEDVDAIIDLLKYSYFFNGEIARMFGVQVHAISDINDGSRHRRNGEKYPIRDWKSSGVILFTYEQVTDIIDLLRNSNLSLNKIAKKYNVYVQSIQQINSGSAKKYRRDGISYPIRSF